jgi:hypothetical protein
MKTTLLAIRVTGAAVIPPSAVLVHAEGDGPPSLEREEATRPCPGVRRRKPWLKPSFDSA